VLYFCNAVVSYYSLVILVLLCHAHGGIPDHFVITEVSHALCFIPFCTMIMIVLYNDNDGSLSNSWGLYIYGHSNNSSMVSKVNYLCSGASSLSSVIFERLGFYQCQAPPKAEVIAK